MARVCLYTDCFGCQHAYYGALVDGRCYWDGVVSWFENKVVQIGLTHGFSGDGEVQCEVSHGDCHDGWIGDVDCSLHVAPVLCLEEDVEIGHVEALELVQT